MVKLNRLTLLGLSLAVSTSACFANAQPATSAHKAKPAPKASPAAAPIAQSLPTPVYPHPWFVQIGANITSLSVPNFKYGDVDQTLYQPKFQYDLFHDNVQPFIGLGYQFQNNRFLPQLFGNVVDLALSVNNVQTDLSSFNPTPGTGTIFGIDGQSIIINNLPLYNAQFTSKQQVTGSKLVLMGDRSASAAPHIYSSPFVGLLYQNAKQDYQFDAETGILSSPIHHDLYENVHSDYYGLQFGDKFSWVINNHWQPFVTADVNAMHVQARLNATQATTVPGLSPSVETVSNNDNKFTYGGDFILGVDFKPLESLILTISGGFNYCNYVPEIVNPMYESNQPAHIEGVSEWNHYAGLTLTLPF